MMDSCLDSVIQTYASGFAVTRFSKIEVDCRYAFAMCIWGDAMHHALCNIAERQRMQRRSSRLLQSVRHAVGSLAFNAVLLLLTTWRHPPAHTTIVTSSLPDCTRALWQQQQSQQEHHNHAELEPLDVMAEALASGAIEQGTAVAAGGSAHAQRLAAQHQGDQPVPGDVQWLSTFVTWKVRSMLIAYVALARIPVPGSSAMNARALLCAMLLWTTPAAPLA
jgi:hypothetical protein